ncbi:MAG: hypothetical protein ABSH38_05555 [Verrucomicrobiota bacterium]|jgi:hypothetical protein
MSNVFRWFLIVVLALARPGWGRAQIAAQDKASNYTSGWNNGANGGSGFLAWILQDNNNTPASDDYSGFFLYTSGTAALDTGNESFGLYANGPDYNEAVAWRGLRAAVAVGQVFEVKFKNNSVAPGGAAGVSLLPTTGAASTNTLSGITSNACLSVYFEGGGADYLLADGNGVTDTGIAWNENGMLLEIAPLSNTNYVLMLRSADGASLQALFVNDRFLNAGPAAGFACYALNPGANGNVFFNQIEVASAAVLPPALLNVTPAGGAAFVDPTIAGVSFEVFSPFSGVAINGITLTLNGVAHSNGLAFAGSATNWFVSTTIPLQANITYIGAIHVTDLNGNTASQTLSFNTWSQGLQFIEAEDYNFYGGNFIANAVPDEYGGAEDGLGALSTNAIAFAGVDAFKPSAPDGGTNVYRPQDTGRVDVNTNSDAPRPVYAEQDLPDYSLVSVQANEWENYTRAFSNVACVVYARMSPVAGAGAMLLEELAAPAATNSCQPRAALGAFVCPANAASPASYTNVPLTDFFGNPVVLRLNGINTLRVTCLSGGYDLNYLLFFPATNTAPLPPYLAAGYPYPGATGVAPDVTVTFTIANRTNAVVPSSIRLFLNGVEVTGATALSNNAAGTTATYPVAALLPSGSANTLQAVFSDGSVWQTNQWQFTAANLPVLPAGDALPFGGAVERGFIVQMAKATNGASSSLFPPSAANAEKQLAGQIINPATGKPFTNEASGPSGTGFFAVTNVLNFRGAGTNLPPVGLFTNNVAPFPGVAATLAGSYTNFPEYFALAAVTYLPLTNGVYRFAVLSDDGFQLGIGATPQSTPVIMSYNGGRGISDPSNPSVQDFVVSQAGMYPFCLLYYQAGADSVLQWYSINRASGEASLINDPADAGAIPAYQLAPVQMVNPIWQGAGFAFGFQAPGAHTNRVQFKDRLTDPVWQTLTNIPGLGVQTTVTDTSATNGGRFYRVVTE